jgi:Tfp pilus assembly protein PilX
MDCLRRAITSREQGAALLIVLAFVVLLTGVSVAYLSRTTSDRQVAHGSFNQSKADQLVASAMDNIIGDLRKEIADGSSATTMADGTKIYTPTTAADMVAQRSGNPAGAPNLMRRSWSADSNLNVRSQASAVNSAPADPADPNRGDITVGRWNKHYLIPKIDTTNDNSDPIASFTAPDWVFVTSDPANTNAGRRVINGPDPLVIGRYAYAIYDESGLLDMNVAGYPTGTTAAQSGRKGSAAYADLTALGNYPIPNGPTYQVDKLVGWRNYATTQPSNLFPAANFAVNFQSSSTPATNFFNYVISNPSGFLNTSTTTWDVNNNGRDLRTDQSFVQRQELIGFRKTIGSTTSFSTNALQYLSTFSRETNSPSFSPSTPAGSTIDYAALANTSTAINPNFLLRRVTTGFTRFDGTTAVVGEPLVKTRFALRRLAWITYKGPSQSRTLPPQSPALPTTHPDYDMWALQWLYGIPASYLQFGKAANLQTCFGLTYGGSPGAWTYSHGATNRILRLDEVAAAGREPDFFELLQAGILSGSLGQNTGGGVTGGNVFPDIHMGNTTHHILSIGAAIIDQADPDSIPTRIQFNPSGTVWTAYGVENLPYITQIYPIAGTSPNTPTQWATYLLFQLWNPHQNAATLPNNVRLRVDGAIGIFTGGNGQTWIAGTTPQLIAAGQSVTLNSTFSFSTAAPLTTASTTNAAPAPGAAGTFVVLAAPAVP